MLGALVGALLPRLDAIMRVWLQESFDRFSANFRQQTNRQIRDEVADRVDIAIADHVSQEHPLGELHSIVDSAVTIRFEHYARIFEQFHVAERAINHLLTTGAIDDHIDQELSASEEDEASA